MPDLKPAQKAFEKALAKVLDPSNMRKYGKMAADMIKLRTRLGYGVETDGSEKGRLKKLTDYTIEKRKEMKKKGLLSSETSPGRSNLTATGQLLDSLGVTSTGVGFAIVSPHGTRDDGQKNEDVGASVTFNGRPFNNLSQTEIKRVNDELRDDLEKIANEELTKLT